MDPSWTERSSTRSKKGKDDSLRCLSQVFFVCVFVFVCLFWMRGVRKALAGVIAV